MKPDSRFVGLGSDFWANVRLISQHVGYTERRRPSRRGEGDNASRRSCGSIKVPILEEITAAVSGIGLGTAHLLQVRSKRATDLGESLLDYFAYRAGALNGLVERQLMDKNQARELFEQLRATLYPKCPLPMNKQKGRKKGPAYFTGIINMLIESNAQGLPCDYDPRQLISVTKKNRPFRTLARWVDGALPFGRSRNTTTRRRSAAASRMASTSRCLTGWNFRNCAIRA